MSPRPKSLGEQVIVPVSHPLRIEIQRILFHRIASPNEVAIELGLEVSTVSHHFNVLEAHGCIVLVREEPRRGAMEHFYKAISAPRHDEREWAALPQAAREGITRLTLKGLFGEAVRALDGKTFDDSKERHLSWIPMILDEEAFLDLVHRQARWLEETEEVQAAAAERLSGEDGLRVIGAILGFKTPPGFGLTGSEW